MALQKKEACTWCMEVGLELTKGHVFPRAIGSTKQVSVPACAKCETIISKKEQELARRSIFALYRMGGGPVVRHKEKPESGSIEVRYALVKDNVVGGYSEVGLRTGQLPVILPCIEVDIGGGSGCRIHGLKPEDVDRLVDALLQSVKGPPDESGCVGEISAALLEENDVDIVSDPDFWPRAFLDLRGYLKIRARNPEEGERFANLIIPLAKKGIFNDHSRWVNSRIVGGTPHHIAIKYDQPSVLQVVAKIAYGVLAFHVGASVLANDPFASLRKYICQETQGEEDSPVQELTDPGNFSAWPDHHLAAIEPYEGKIRGIVVLYGGCFVIQFGPLQGISTNTLPVIAMSRRDGTHTRIADNNTAHQVLRDLRNLVGKLLD